MFREINKCNKSFFQALRIGQLWAVETIFKKTKHKWNWNRSNFDRCPSQKWPLRWPYPLRLTPLTSFLARFDYWRNVDAMRRTGNSKIQAPVLALVGEADPDRRNILHSLMEWSTSLTTMEMKGTTLMHATSPKQISYQINNFIRTNLFVPTVRFRMNA